MQATQTYGGILAMTTQVRMELGMVDRIMHEINLKVMAFPSGLEMKRKWLDIYERWNGLALNHPLVTSPEPRLMPTELADVALRVARLKAEALALYGAWKTAMASAGIATSKPAQSSSGASVQAAPAATITQQAVQEKPGILKILLYGAALFGGAAAIHQLWRAWRTPAQSAQPQYIPYPPAYAPALPSMVAAPPPPPLMLPSVPPMAANASLGQSTLAFQLPPEAEEDLSQGEETDLSVI